MLGCASAIGGAPVKKYSSRTGSRALYFSPVEFFPYHVVPCSMFYEAHSESRIAAHTRAASRAAFRRAPQLHPRISLISRPSLAQRLAASEGSLVTTAPQFLIVTPRLESPTSATKQTLPAISNRYKLRLLQLGTACTSPFAAASSLQPLLPCLQNPWPPVGGRLIANLELESRINPIRITRLQFSNRKFLAILSFPMRAANRESQAAALLIENARLNSDLSGNDSSRLQISNRERIGVSRSAALSKSSKLPIPSLISKPPIPNLPRARRIRDTCTDIPSLHAFLRCYASCGSRRKSE